MNKRKSAISKDYYGYIFMAPFIIIFLAFIMIPIFNTFYLSLTDARIRPGTWGGDFVGIANFIELLGEPMFQLAVRNTWMLWLFNFVPQMILALVLAAMFTSTTFKLKGTGFFKAAYYLPNLLMPVTIAALFQSFLGLLGPVNQVMVGTLGIWDTARNFLQNATDVRITVIFLQTWMWFGQTAIVLVAGMTAISPSLYESAMIDGASQAKMFFKITIPLLKPILLFVLVTSLVGGLHMFDIPHLLAGSFGNPGNSVLTVNMLMNNRRGAPSLLLGNSAAISVLLFFMSSFVALVVFRLFRDPAEKRES